MLKVQSKSKIILIVSIFIIFGFSLKNEQESAILFPEPFAFSIHDMGWLIGNNDADIEGVNGPFRAGVDRVFDVYDYEAVVRIAQEAGTRIRCMFVTCELDRLNILKNYPTTTWEGEHWNNEHVCEQQLEIMDYVKNHAANLEFGLHGVGHGYWPTVGKMHAEWYNSRDHHPWPKQNIVNHISAMKEILAQYGLSEAKGHSFPESFDAGNNSYYWNPNPSDNEYSLGALLSKEGCKYVSNDPRSFPRENHPPIGPNSGGVDNGVIVICKGGGGVTWYKYSSLPKIPLEEQGCNMTRLHFPNFLAQDRFLQESINRKFIDYYRMVQATPNRYVTKNTEQFYAQWLYQKYTKVENGSTKQILIDNRKMPDDIYKYGLIGNLLLKIKLNDGEHIGNVRINEKSIASYYEDQGYGFMYLPPLEKKEYKVTYSLDNKVLMPHVYNDGTYNVYHFNYNGKNGMEIKVRTYGVQKLKIRNVIDYPGNAINSNNPNLKIKKLGYNKETREIILLLNAHDLQGETATIKMN